LFTWQQVEPGYFINILKRKMINYMKRLYAVFILVLAVNFCAAQADGVGIGTTTPHESAILDITAPSGNKGLLIPRLTNDQMNNLTSRATEGLVIYNTSYHAFYFFYNTKWQAVGSPRGTIVMWSGALNAIPEGWVLCDGNNSTPDLRNRFIVGAGAAYGVGNTGGANTVTLTVNQMPSHTHSISAAPDHQHFVREVSRGEEGNSGTDQSVGSYNEGGADKWTSPAGGHTHTIGTAGNNEPHENRPPYYALAYIMKL
jgi:microcystin-dependent protein